MEVISYYRGTFRLSFLEFERFVLIWSVLYGASTVFTLLGGVTYNVNCVWLYIHIENGLVMAMWIGQPTLSRRCLVYPH